MGKGWAAGLAVLVLGGCGDPAKQTPVEMQPGNYEVAMAGSLLGMQTQAESQGSRCVSTSPEHVPTALVRPFMALHEECAGARFERTGNKLTGTATCPLDPAKVAGTATVHFEGTIAADSLEGELSIKLDVEDMKSAEARLGIGMVNAAKMPFTAKRTGACTGSSGGGQRTTTTSANEEVSGEPESDYTPE